MIGVKVQMFINGRYSYSKKIMVDSTPPKGEADLEQVTQLLRGALQALDPHAEYQMDITRRET